MSLKQARRRRNAIRLSERACKIVELYLQGNTQAEIAQQVGVCIGTVNKSLKASRKAWQDEELNLMGQWIREELKKIALVEREAWRGWFRSIENKETVVEEETESGVRRRKTLEGQAGSPAFLQRMLDCMQRRAALLGLDAPRRSEITGPDGGPLQVRRADEITDAELILIAFGGGGGVAEKEEGAGEDAGLHDLREAGLPRELSPPTPV